MRSAGRNIPQGVKGWAHPGRRFQRFLRRRGRRPHKPPAPSSARHSSASQRPPQTPRDRETGSSRQTAATMRTMPLRPFSVSWTMPPVCTAAWRRYGAFADAAFCSIVRDNGCQSQSGCPCVRCGTPQRTPRRERSPFSKSHARFSEMVFICFHHLKSRTYALLPTGKSRSHFRSTK